MTNGSLIDRVVLKAVFNSILDTCMLRRPVHMSKFSWCSLTNYFAQYHFKATGKSLLLSNITNVETMDSGERGMSGKIDNKRTMMVLYRSTETTKE